MAPGVGSWPKCLTRRGQKNLVTERGEQRKTDRQKNNQRMALGRIRGFRFSKHFLGL